MKLDDKLTAERRRERDPDARLERREAQHRREVEVVRDMYKSEIQKHEAEIKSLREIAELRINERNNMYEGKKAKDEEMKTLTAKVMDIEKELKIGREKLKEVTNSLQSKETECMTRTEDLNTSRQNEIDQMNEIQKWKTEYEKLKARTEELESGKNIEVQSREKKRKIDDPTEKDHTVRTKSVDGRGKAVGKNPISSKFTTPDSSTGLVFSPRKNSCSGQDSDGMGSLSGKESSSIKDCYVMVSRTKVPRTSKSLPSSPPPSPSAGAIPSIKISTEEWPVSNLQEYSDAQMEEEDNTGIMTGTDTDSGSDNSKKRERDREYFKTPYPAKPKRDNKEKLLK